MCFCYFSLERDFKKNEYCFYFRAVKYKPRGVSSRRAAMQWVLQNRKSQKSVIYFADDDNTYDLQVST